MTSAAPLRALEARRRRPWATAVLLIALAAVVVLERVHTAAEPLERDVAGYAVIGHEMNRGRHLYADLWDRKPPLMCGSFAAAERVTGYGPGEVLALNLAASLATLGGCYAAGGPGAAVLYVLVGGDPWVLANQPNAEAFINAALAWAVVPLVGRRAVTWRAAVAVGAGMTVATMYEQHQLVTCAAVAVGYVVAAGRGAVGRRSAVMGVAAATGAIVWGTVVAYYAAVGRLGAAVDVLFHQLFHGVTLTGNLAAGLRPARLFPAVLAWGLAPLVLVAAAAAVGRRPGGDRRWIVWVGWAVGTWAVVALPGAFFPHYYQCWIPPLCVAGGWAIDRLCGGRRGLAGPAVVAVVLVGLAARELPPYGWGPDRWAAEKYPSENFAEQVAVGRQLADVLGPVGARFWVFGSDPTLYFAARQSPVTGLMYLEPLIDDPDPSGWRRLVADLDRARPAVVLVRRSFMPWVPADCPARAYVAAHYRPVDPAPGLPTATSYGVWVRRDAPAAVVARLAVGQADR